MTRLTRFIRFYRFADQNLDWQPKFSNSQALIKSYQWYLDHYQKIKSKKTGVTHTVGWNQGILGFFKKWL
jgi:dTDP-D-glucose 4,6-dehydratase